MRFAFYTFFAFLSLLMLGACGERRDAADMAVGVAPFERLRGMDVVQLRSGGVRALRSAAVPAPFEGLREMVGEYDVLYAIPGFDGSDGAWPNEDALVAYVEAVRDWPTDALAEAGWRRAMRELQAGLGVAPTCVTLSGPGFALRVAEWEQGGGWSVSTTYAPAEVARTDTLASARHSITVRRQALTAQYPQAGAGNPRDLPTWTSLPCAAGPPSDMATPAGKP
ncbi:MAG: hypothetical protein K8S21_00665 [Gemmatimonadetes bacterium]|nr:hypothetical protein [Gemmatimonadota bacterium]